MATNKLPPLKTTQLDGHDLDEVSSYKYLGININSELNWSQQWDLVYEKIRSAPYLLRQLRQAGFRKSILINVHRSYVLSHFAYSAPALTSATNKMLQEMEAFQRRCFKAIGIKPERAELEYNIASIQQHMVKQCATTITRILKDPEHLITKKLHRTIARPGHPSKFKPNKVRTNTYRDNVLQSYLRTIQNGCADLYMPKATAINKIVAITVPGMRPPM